MLMRPASETQITHLGRLWLYVLAGLVMLFLILPVFVVIPMSFSDSRFLRFPLQGLSLRWFYSYLQSPKKDLCITRAIADIPRPAAPSGSACLPPGRRFGRPNTL